MLLCFPTGKDVIVPECDSCSDTIPPSDTVFVIALGKKRTHISLCMKCFLILKADFEAFQKKGEKR